MPKKSIAEDWLTEDGLLKIEEWTREGLIDKQIAENIGISERTFIRWKNANPSLVSALKKGKAPADAHVENALFKSATGYTVTVKKPIKLRTKRMLKDKGTIEEEHIEYVDEEVHVPANTIAQIFWLKNRKPERWKDKPQASQTAVVQDDGFIEALKDTAETDWSNEDEDNGAEQEE